MNYKTVSWVLRAAGFLLVFGLLPLDFGYYTFLRLAVSVAAVTLWVAVSKTRLATWIVLSVATLVIFPASWGLTSDKATWIILDLVFGVAYFLAANAVSKLPKN